MNEKKQKGSTQKKYERFPIDFKPEILSAFKEACQKNGKTPTAVIKEFVSSYIYQELAIEVEKTKPKGYTQAQLIGLLKERAEELGRAPVVKEMERPSGRTYINRFGTWKKALEAAGLERKKIVAEKPEQTSHRGYTKECLAEKIKQRAHELGRPPKNTEMTNPSGRTYIRAFGTWNEALRAAGYQPDYPRDGFDHKKLIEQLKEEAGRLGRTPLASEMANPCGNLYMREFGTWDKALEAAGLKPERSTRRKAYTKEELIQKIQEKAQELGRIPNYNEVSRPYYSTYVKYFGSWEKALAEAGLSKEK